LKRHLLPVCAQVFSFFEKRRCNLRNKERERTISPVPGGGGSTGAAQSKENFYFGEWKLPVRAENLIIALRIRCEQIGSQEIPLNNFCK